MKRSITIFTGPYYDEMKEALESLANRVVPDSAAGQRGAKLSKMFDLLALSYRSCPNRVTALIEEAITVMGRDDDPLAKVEDSDDDSTNHSA